MNSRGRGSCRPPNPCHLQSCHHNLFAQITTCATIASVSSSYSCPDYRGGVTTHAPLGMILSALDLVPARFCSWAHPKRPHTIRRWSLYL
ncbi:hypothetical protein TIFTF001_036713 [Ficus carica]|uniref:Uncharacterized protein n=1 Tax=Ficus carica TaxID=3494 RepID=A0AA88E5T9_FICCA|nr:hypothetical protein TIFTF001_036713 [Ficus carica]